MLPFALLGQVDIDTTLAIDSIHVDGLIILADPSQSHNIQTGSRSTSIANSINENSTSFVRSYGPGSIATLSIRGGSAQQSDVQWMGISISHPMLGLTDLSLISPQLFDQSTLTTGSSSALAGSGGLTGVLQLNNAKEQNQFESLVSVGSFGHFSSTTKISLTGKKSVTRVKANATKSQNDFPFEAFQNAPLQDLTNAQFKQASVIVDHIYQINAQHQISGHLWLQNAHREIPPTLNQTRSNAFQSDKNTRAVLRWKHTHKNFNVELKAGYFKDLIRYVDPSILVDSPSDGSKSFLDFTFTQKLTSHFNWGLGLRGENWKGDSPFYQESNSEIRSTSRLYVVYARNNLKLNGGVSMSSRGNSWAPASPDLQFSYSLKPSSFVYIRSNYNFRFPSLNDLYWRPGGNLELAPEQGWNKEIGYNGKQSIKGMSLNFNAVLFHRKIKNWILWSKPENANIWAAYNIAEVKSQGSELNITANFLSHNYFFEIKTSHQWVESAHQQSLTLPRVEAGDQLIFTPKHRWTTQVMINKKDWRYRLTSEYTSSAIGINNNISEYFLFNSSISKTIITNLWSASCTIELNNILNRNYQIVEARPMPGRSLLLTLQFNVN